MLSDALPAGTADEGYVLALAATFLTDGDATAEALWGINRAADWAGFRSALEPFVGPQQNIVYGDSTGAIGFIAPGRIPIRKRGNGWLPVPGWTGDHDWTGFIPFAELPQATNPVSGRFVSANNKIVPDSYPYFLSRDWDVPNRFERIEELLAATPQQSLPASAAMQADTLSIMARRMVPLMTAIDPRSAAAQDAVVWLRRWDFRMDRDQVEPLIFAAWLRKFTAEVLSVRFGEAAEAFSDIRPQVIETILRERPDWCGDKTGAPTTSCNPRLEAALDAALAELRRDYGPDMSSWRWGRAHIANFPNLVLGRIPMLRAWVRVAIPTSGGNDTLNRAPVSPRDPAHPFEQVFGAGLRIITDLANPTESRMIATPGQSGNPLSPHFSDLLERWRQFEWLVPGRATPTSTLTLAPR